jgi:hypothetical protein
MVTAGWGIEDWGFRPVAAGFRGPGARWQQGLGGLGRGGSRV